MKLIINENYEGMTAKKTIQLYAKDTSNLFWKGVDIACDEDGEMVAYASRMNDAEVLLASVEEWAEYDPLEGLSDQQLRLN